MREVLLYGTSANPLCGLQGHLGAIAYSRSLFDEVWILPVYRHIFSSKSNLAPFNDRVNMCHLSLQSLPSIEQHTHGKIGQVKVVEYEYELYEQLAAATDKPEELRIGSIDIVRYLISLYPDTTFTMLLGGDTFADLHAGKWKNGDELQRLVKLLVMSRKGFNPPTNLLMDGSVQEAVASGRVQFITIPTLGDASSTYARSLKDIDRLKALVTPPVAQYIIEHKLYAFAE